ncbi:MAG: transcriptional regulator [Methanobacterium sp. Maddingley MBC34]|nr:MAG: transcriptional regulator [Methanobacterium sp. Maddingley MBC34]
MQNKDIKASNSQTEAKKTTKEKIFDASVDLFSEKGFNDVTVREIAKEAGIREGSIYNHYKNKEAILDAIIDYFKSEITQNDLPEEESRKLMDQGPEVFFEDGAQMFMDRINIPQMEKIWRLVCIETYRNEKIREFFKKELLEEPLAGWENIFSIMIEKKMIKPVNPRTLAYEYWSYAIFLFFEYFILKYDEDFDSFMKLGLEKMINHTRFMFDAIKIEEEIN